MVGAGTLLDPDGAHHRLRAPVRHLQARQPDLPRSRSAAPAAGRSVAPGADHLRGQGAPGRQSRARKSSRASTSSPATPSSRAGWRSSRTTTCTWPTCWCRAWTSGSTCRGCRSRPRGTSGMKAALNGVPQLSTLDGWWQEGYDGLSGWAISPAGESEDADAADAERLLPAARGAGHSALLHPQRRRRPARLGREDAPRAAAGRLAGSPRGAWCRTTCRSTTLRRSGARRPGDDPPTA